MSRLPTVFVNYTALIYIKFRNDSCAWALLFPCYNGYSEKEFEKELRSRLEKKDLQIAAISADIDKIDNKAAKARVRKATLELAKLGKEYRKASI